jgi:hypothetical protein
LRIGRPSHSTVVAYLALFAALSGSAFAISKGAIKSRHIAKNAVKSKQIAANAVKTAEVADGAIISSKLAAGAVSTSRIADGAVTNPKLAGDAVDAAKVLDNSLSDDELAPSAQFNGAVADGDLDGTYPNPTLEANSVAASEVSNGALGTAEFASGIPAAHVTHSADQPFATSGFNTVAFNQERYDTAGIHSTVTNNSRLTAPVDGIYLVTASVRWESSTAGVRQLAIEGEIGGVTTSLANSDTPATGLSHQSLAHVIQLSAGDYVELEVRQDSGGELDLDKANQNSPEFTLNWLAPGP